MKIGFFDSGLGGLTILTAVRKHLPEYDYLYFGDTENLPYGDKTEDEIFLLTEKGVRRLFDDGALLIVVACNTASAASVRKLQDELVRHEYPDRKLLGVIIPTVETLLDSGARSALLIGTIRTIQSEKYEIELKKKDANLTLHTRSTPTLVPKIESGDFQGACDDVHAIIETLKNDIDTIVLGCTHYTILKRCIESRHALTIISQDDIIPKKLDDYLTRHPEIEERLSKKGSVEVHLSKEAPMYEEMKKEILTHIE